MGINSYTKKQNMYQHSKLDRQVDLDPSVFRNALTTCVPEKPPPLNQHKRKSETLIIPREGEGRKMRKERM
jgi:hypothetical protein